jgi:hypothetical protein
LAARDHGVRSLREPARESNDGSQRQLMVDARRFVKCIRGRLVEAPASPPASVSPRLMGRRHLLALIAITITAPLGSASAQGYYNLDAGRPGRVEDASPTARYELELQLLPVRFERFGGGGTRWRSDP